MEPVAQLLSTWNPPPLAHLTRVVIEDETLRDGLQAPFARRPSLDEKLRLMHLSAEVGVGQAMLGFPCSSAREHSDCLALLRTTAEAKSPVAAHFLGRAVPDDLAPIAALQQAVGWPVWADFWINACPLRMKIEGWTHASIHHALGAASTFLSRETIPFCVSLEDATRTPGLALAEFVTASIESGAGMIAICDTAGEATPEGAAQLTRFVIDCIAQRGQEIPVLWHGHNDRGLALANALAAANAGAAVISGTMLGIGERAGNTAIDQAIVYLHQAGHPMLRPDRLSAYAETLAAALGVSIPPAQPLVGSQAFATAAGTHAAAVVKALTMARAYADHVFSAVPAASLGCEQSILVGPLMGAVGARYKLQQLGIDASDPHVRGLLALARKRDRCLDDAEIRHHFLNS